MNKAADYIEDLKYDREYKFEDCDFCLSEDEAEKAINIALEQVRKEVKESKDWDLEHISLSNLDKIINNLKL